MPLENIREEKKQFTTNLLSHPDSYVNNHILARAERIKNPVVRQHKKLTTAMLDNIDSTHDEFTGDILRTLRERTQTSIEEMADVTKINKRYLLALESHDFEALPASTYVRGFVAEYAKTIGLDPKVVCQSYMRHYKKQSDATA